MKSRSAQEAGRSALSACLDQLASLTELIESAFFSAFCELTSVEWWSAFNYVSWISSLLVTFRFEWSHSKHTFFTTTEILIKGKVPRNQNYLTNVHELTFSKFASVTTSLPIMENLLIFNDSQGRWFADGAKVSLLLAVSSSKVPLPD